MNSLDGNFFKDTGVVVRAHNISKCSFGAAVANTSQVVALFVLYTIQEATVALTKVLTLYKGLKLQILFKNTNLN